MPKPITVWLDDKDFEQLHNMMLTVLRDKDSGVVLARMFNGKKKQEWYRIVLEKGLVMLFLEFDEERKKYAARNCR